MDHLPHPSGAFLIEVPFLVTEMYDGSDFMSYPARKGWNITDWRSAMLVTRESIEQFDFNHGKTLSETLVFIQTWLCLGLLQSVLACRIDADDFLHVSSDGNRTWTNRKLELHLAQYKIRCEHLQERQREAVFTSALAFINEASAIGSVLDSYARLQVSLGYPDLVVGLQQQTFLVQMMQDALCSAIRNILRPGVWHGTTNRGAGDPYMNSWLQYHFEQANWCPSTVHALGLQFDHGVQAYAFTMGTIRTKKNHESCSLQKCVANQFDGHGAAQHRQPGCYCADVAINTRDVVEILRRGQIPGLVIKRTLDPNGPIKLTVKPLEAGSAYITVSHVWADGLANPDSNQLPTCQLEYLHELLDLLPALQDVSALVEDSEGIPIWFDGLCIPVEPEHQSLRDFSIAKMRDIYNDSDGVIVLDPDIQKLQPDASAAEILMRVLLSGWSSRLWTFQEGALVLDTYLAGDKCIINLRDIRRKFAKRKLKEPRLSLTLLPSLRARLLRHVVLHESSLQTRPELGYGRLLGAISRRSTTRSNDETVVLSSFLKLDTSRLLREQSAARRMVTFMQMLPFVPTSLLFAWGPRVCLRDTASDWGWVPETLLAPYGVNDLIIDDQDIPLDLGQPNERFPRPSSYIHPSPHRGLATFLPGIDIFPTEYDISEHEFVVSTSAGTFLVKDDDYREPNIPGDNPGRLRPWVFRIPGLRSALILSSFEPLDMYRSPALLVHFADCRKYSIDDSGEFKGRTYRNVFVSRMVTINTAQVILDRSDLRERIRECVEVRGRLLDPSWWLVNPFAADHEQQRRSYLEVYSIRESMPWIVPQMTPTPRETGPRTTVTTSPETTRSG